MTKLSFIKIITFGILLSFNSNVGFCQDLEQQKDSILNLIETLEADSLKAKQFVILSRKFIYYNPASAINYAQQAIEYSQRGNYPKGKMRAAQVIYNSHHVLGSNADTLLKNLKLYEKYALETENDLDMMGVYFSYGLFYSNIGQLDKELEAYFKTLKLVQKHIPKSNKEVILLNNIANAYNRKMENEKALKYYKKALNFAKNNDSRASLMANIASIHLDKLEKLDTVKVLLDDAQHLYEKENDLNGLAFVLIYKGRYLDARKQYKKAYKKYNEALTLIDKNELGQHKADLYHLMSYHFYDQKKYNEVIIHAEKMIDIAVNDQQNLKFIEAVYKILHESYEIVGNYKRAYEVQGDLIAFNDSTNTIQLQSKIKSLQTEFEVEQKETENELLKMSLQSRKRLSIILILALLFASALIFVVFRSNQQRKKYNQILEQTVAERTKNLEQANYELRTFNYIASHDIKEPIRVIGGHVGLIKKSLPNDLKESLSEYFHTIKRSSNQLYTLIEDFALYTNMSKEDSIQKQNINLNNLASNVMNGLQETMQEYKGQVIVSELPTILSSSSLLFTVLKNLIENGLKFNTSEKPIVHINYEQTTTHHKIIIADNGIGIHKDYHKKIFEMFNRLHTRKAYKGSGIGLAIAKLCIDKLNGDLDLKSEEGNGSQFIIQLPKT